MTGRDIDECTHLPYMRIEANDNNELDMTGRSINDLDGDMQKSSC